ncbi:MAG: Crp/Fnr family transcriptional regulator [Aquamicrobium sp.]|uniref:Crp/Fnr family transcriptional regulator n=1 Tax=Aquamicrobium sp. TaxID=1872579 RepID=UPI00349EED59|nr:Crp/Fnr family transcriptional regulator [Aquamicrobium sp.]
MGVLQKTFPVRTAGRGGDCGCVTRLHSPRELVFREHDRASRVYVVDEGLVMLSHIFCDGRRHIVDLVGPGELCAWESDAIHGCTAETLTFATITSYDMARVDESPALERDLSRRLRASLRRVQGHTAMLGRKTALERVASLIQRLAEICDPDGDEVYLPLTRREIADHLGITQETASRSFSELKRRCIICHLSPSEVRIENPAALARLAGSRMEGLPAPRRPMAEIAAGF